MSLIIREWNIEKNFWELHPELIACAEYRELRNRDTSVKIKEYNHDDSSIMMWAIAYAFDYESPVGHWDEEEKIRWAEDNILSSRMQQSARGYFLSNKTFLEPLIALYMKLQETCETRYLREWETQIDRRVKFIQSQEYKSTTWEMLDKMLVDSDKILAQKDKVLARMKDGKGSRTKGGVVLTLLASGKLDGILSEQFQGNRGAYPKVESNPFI